MDLTIASSPKHILDTWNSSLQLAESTIQAVGKELELPDQGIVDLTVSIKTLNNAVTTLETTRKVASEKLAYEDRCCFCSYQSLLTFTGTALDTVLQIVTAGFWVNTIASDTVDSNTSIATAGATLGSAFASKIKDRIFTKQEQFIEMCAQLEEIVPNQLAIDHIRRTIDVLNGYKSRSNKTKKVPKRYQSYLPQDRMNPPVRQDLKEVFQRAVGRVVEERSRSASVTASQIEVSVEKPIDPKIRKQYVTQLLGVYSRLNGENIVELAEKFVALKKLIDQEVTNVGEALNENPTANLAVSIHQLESHLEELQVIFSTVTDVLKLYEEMEEGRLKCVARGVRTTVQFVLELGSLASAVIQAIAVNQGTDNSMATVAGSSLYLINIILSWVNTGIEKVGLADGQAYQQLRRLEGQAAFVTQVGHMGSILKGYQRVVNEESVSEEDATKVMKARVPSAFRSMIGGGSVFRERLEQAVLSRAPQVAEPGTPLDRAIQEIYSEGLATDAKPTDNGWTDYLRLTVGSPKSMKRASSTGRDTPVGSGSVRRVSSQPVMSPKKPVRGVGLDDLMVFCDSEDSSAESDLEDPLSTSLQAKYVGTEV